jgi:exodeoxyribonuclease VII small subunit
MSEGTAADADAQPRYEEAMAELEQIISDLQADEVGVDELAARVRRGAQLLELCRERLRGTELAVQDVVDALEADATGAADAATPPSPEAAPTSRGSTSSEGPAPPGGRPPSEGRPSAGGTTGSEPTRPSEDRPSAEPDVSGPGRSSPEPAPPRDAPPTPPPPDEPPEESLF